MPGRRYLIYPALSVVLASGCLCFQSTRPIAVRAVDAETKQPIPGAVVRISYPLTRTYRSPVGSFPPSPATTAAPC